MFHLLTSPRTARTVRSLIGALVETAADTLRSLAPAETPAVEGTTAPDPADVYGVDELPEVDTIETAATDYDEAADQARAADRAKRKARKLLDRLPAGRYGQWLIRRIESSRETPDLVAIRATYERLGLGDVPMRKVAPSLRVERVETESTAPAAVAAMAA
ncbi:hypothetical protein OG194_18930 [Streptomyces sp. NBC_01288]|uniref:hypothetical protein n=1 Tax=Streptomyces sp. NBC_01288 TaxID=2903814 RepID=UPI002E0E96D5|nr:hypothetical protein OG194_18930 [Streptomyces sp. NBC_01288]